MVKLLCLFLLALVYAKEEFRGPRSESLAFCFLFLSDQVLRITPSNQQEVEYLQKWVHQNQDKLNVWVEPFAPGEYCDVHVNAVDLKDVRTMLMKYNIGYKVLINDVEDAVQEEYISNIKNAFSGGFSYDKYNTYSEIRSELGSLVRSYPSRASLINFGRSFQGKAMIGIKISSGGGNKPIIWIDGGIHAREWISPASTMYLVRELVKGSSNAATNVLNKYDFHILPVFNVDGYEYTQQGGRARMWRKTRSSGSFWCLGADPNRNWDVNFGGVGTSSNPCSDTYPGDSPFSEIEVKNVATYLQGIQQRLKGFWTIHAYSQLVLTPWGYKRDLPRDYAEIKRVGDVFARVVSQLYGTRYRVGSIANILYPASGGSIDWVYAKLGVRYSYGLELRDTGRHGFLLPTRYIIPTARETTAAILAAVSEMK